MAEPSKKCFILFGYFSFHIFFHKLPCLVKRCLSNGRRIKRKGVHRTATCTVCPQAIKESGNKYRSTISSSGHSSQPKRYPRQTPPLKQKFESSSFTRQAETKMGFEKQILKAGNGPKPVKGQKVTVHCTGYGKDRDLSKKFWSTKDPGQQPFGFNIGLGSVIKGWDEGVMTMQVGEVARIQCTPDYAYGAGGFPAWGIQPNSVLVFEIEVLSAQ